MPQNGINHPGITALAQAFALNPLLRVINLNDNTFTEKGAMAMAEVSAFQLYAVFLILITVIKACKDAEWELLLARLSWSCMVHFCDVAYMWSLFYSDPEETQTSGSDQLW